MCDLLGPGTRSGTGYRRGDDQTMALSLENRSPQGTAGRRFGVAKVAGPAGSVVVSPKNSTSTPRPFRSRSASRATPFLSATIASSRRMTSPLPVASTISMPIVPTHGCEPVSDPLIARVARPLRPPGCLHRWRPEPPPPSSRHGAERRPSPFRRPAAVTSNSRPSTFV